MMKSSAYRTRCTLRRSAVPPCGLGNRSLSLRSRPSSARLARTGETMPPCGVPSSVGWKACFSMNPAFSHFRRMALSIGTWASNQSWLIRSKHDLMSPSKTHRRRALAGQDDVALHHRIGGGSFLPEPVGVRVGGRLGDGVQGEQVEGLHGPVPHRRDAEGAHLAVALRDVHPTQRLGR